MSIATRIAAVVAAVASTTCCPSLFLTITKSNPSPHPSLPEPKVAAEPLLLPHDIDNRFDVLSADAKPGDYADFDDAATGGRIVTSIKALRKIQDVFGVASAPDLAAGQEAGPMDACVACTGEGANLTCSSLVIKFSGYPFRASDKPRITFLPPTRAENIAKFTATIHEQKDFLAPCDGRSGDKLVELDTPLDGVQAGDHLTVTMANFPLPTIAAFIHLSDVQIRDPDIRVGDRILSKHLDKLISSFEYDNDLELYNRYMVQALFATINRIHVVLPEVQFAIHTGDSIDSGVTTELREFHRLFDTLAIPAYNVLGNHDVLVFGNMLATTSNRDDDCITAISQALSGSEKAAPAGPLIPNRICVKEAIECPNCLPGEAKLVAGTTHEASHTSFMTEFRQHSPADALAEPPALPTTEDAEYCPAIMKGTQPIEAAIRIQGTTLQHGFDLNKATPQSEPPGYYAFAWDIKINDEARHALYIALNTNDLDEHEGGKVGRINARQLKWLKETLKCVETRHAKDLVFVFGHHGLHDTKPPKGTVESIEHVLATSKNVIAYFYGHQHDHGICQHKGSCQHFWEVMTGSVIEFPQEARLVRVKSAGKGLGFLELTTFGERIENGDDEFGKAVELAHRGARHDYCANHDPADCSDDQRPYRNDGRHTSARLFFRLPEYKDCCTPLPRR